MKDLPRSGWEEVTVGEVVTLHYGKALPREERKPNGHVPVYGANGVKDNADRSLTDGPSLVIGRKGSAGEITRVDGPFWPLDVTYYTSHDLTRLDFDYLHYALSLMNLPQLAKGVKPGINRNDVYSLPLALPPLDEQKRIVVVLDEAFEGLARAQANAEANLQDAWELYRNEVHRALFQAGDSWQHKTLGQVCSRFEYGTSQKSRPQGAVPVLRMGNLQDGEIDWSDLVFTENQDDIRQLSLRQNDILFNRTNSLEHVGKTAIYRGDRPAIFAGYLIRVHYDEDSLDPEFLNLFLNSERTRSHGRSVSGKSVNQANISASKLKDYEIALPPISEQRLIVERLLSLKASVAALQEEYERQTEDLNELRRSLLHKAFSGQLANQIERA
ncbi:MAG: restriction endonuclease subunit S [Paracoccaceae bacterium]